MARRVRVVDDLVVPSTRRDAGVSHAVVGEALAKRPGAEAEAERLAAEAGSAEPSDPADTPAD